MTYEEFFQYMRSHLVGSRWATDSVILYFWFPDFKASHNWETPKGKTANASILVFDNGRSMDCTPVPEMKYVSDEDYAKTLKALATMERLKQ